MDSTAMSFMLGLMMIASCLLNNGAVRACAVGADACTKCSDDDLCVKCADGFALDTSTSTCKPKQAAIVCDSNCHPSSGCTEAGKCSNKCNHGFALVNNICQACDVNCDLTVAGCSKPFTCDQKCKIGFYLFQDPNGVKTCLPCHEYCAGTCDTAGAFLCDEGQCEAGYTTGKQTKTCQRCGNGCDITVGCNIAGPGRCDKCLPGYTLDPTKHACYPSSSNGL